MFLLPENRSRAREKWLLETTLKFYAKKGLETTFISRFFAKKTQLVGGKQAGHRYQ
jgi:hypothetical protein